MRPGMWAWLLLLLGLVMLMGQPVATDGISPADSGTRDSSQRVQPTPIVKGDNVLSDTGETPVRRNVLYNPSFEMGGMRDIPSGWSAYGTVLLRTNASYGKDSVSGTHCGRAYVGGTYQWSGTSTLWQGLSDRPWLNESVTFAVAVKPISADFSRDSCLSVGVVVYSYQDSAAYELRYQVFRGASPWSNQTRMKYVLVNKTQGVWSVVTRNVTRDFQSEFGLDPSQTQVTRVYAMGLSLGGSTVPSELHVDDVNLLNRTAYNYVANHDFEGSGSWGTDSPQSPAIIDRQDDTVTHGRWAVNMTTHNLNASDSSSVSLNKYFSYPWGPFCTGPNTLVLSLDWMYCPTLVGPGDWAYISVSMRNSTHFLTVRWTFGSGGGDVYGSNSTTSLALPAEHFGTVNTWVHFEVDLYEVFQAFTSGPLNLRAIYLQMYDATGNESKQCLLVDNVALVTYPTYDPGFDVQMEPTSSYPTGSWYSYDPPSEANLTSDAHTGPTAARTTASPNSMAYMVAYTWVELTDDLWTDMWAKVDRVVGSDWSARIVLALNNTWNIHYVINASGTPLVNGTWDKYLLPDESPAVGEWVNIVRAPLEDARAALGPGNYFLSSVMLYLRTGSSTEVSVIWDDINLVTDTHPPEVADIATDPSNPVYDSDVEVSAIVSDNIDLETAELHYRVDGGTYVVVPLRPLGGRHRATIPGAPWGTVVEYYITATDHSGHVTTADDGGSPFTYTVGDTQVPFVAVVTPSDGAVVRDTVTVDVLVHDHSENASGIDRVELHIGGEVVATSNAPPYQLVWDSREVDNGTYDAEVWAFDNAGNHNVTSVTIALDNDFDPPVLRLLEVSPARPMPNGTLQLLVAATDRTGVDRVVVYYSTGGPVWHGLLMDADMGVYNATVPIPSDKTGTLQYYVVAVDSYGQSSSIGNTLSPMTVDWGDTSPPEVLGMAINPVAPEYDTPVTVVVTVRDESPVANATLFYRTGGAAWHQVGMTYGGDTCLGQIPAQPWGATVDFYVFVADMYDNNATLGSAAAPFNYTVGDTRPPLLAFIGPVTGSTVRGNVTLAASAQDAGSGVTHITIELNGTVVASGSSECSFLWVTTDHENGHYVVTVTATDGAGNSVSQQIVYEVHNPVGIEGVMEGLSTVLQQYGFLIGAGGTLVALVVGRALIRRRAAVEAAGAAAPASEGGAPSKDAKTSSSGPKAKKGGKKEE